MSELLPGVAETLLVVFIAVCTIAGLCFLAVGIIDLVRERRDRREAAADAERLRILRDTIIVKSQLDQAAFRASRALRQAAERARNQAP